MESEKSGFVNEMSEIWRKMQVNVCNFQPRLVNLKYEYIVFGALLAQR